jgi:hypothetical protein
MKVRSMNKERGMAMANVFGLMEPLMKALGKITRDLARENSKGQMGCFIKAIGLMI